MCQSTRCCYHVDSYRLSGSAKLRSFDLMESPWTAIRPVTRIWYPFDMLL